MIATAHSPVVSEREKEIEQAHQVYICIAPRRCCWRNCRELDESIACVCVCVCAARTYYSPFYISSGGCARRPAGRLTPSADCNFICGRCDQWNIALRHQPPRRTDDDTPLAITHNTIHTAPPRTLPHWFFVLQRAALLYLLRIYVPGPLVLFAKRSTTLSVP